VSLTELRREIQAGSLTSYVGFLCHLLLYLRASCLVDLEALPEARPGSENRGRER
jgi:hypothetical protein